MKKKININFNFVSEDTNIDETRLNELSNLMLAGIQDSLDNKEVIIKSFNVKLTEE